MNHPVAYAIVIYLYKNNNDDNKSIVVIIYVVKMGRYYC